MSDLLLSRRAVAVGLLSTFVGSPTVQAAPRRAVQSTWRQLTTEPYRGKQDDICFISPNVGWYGNGAGKLYHTVDGGESWRKIWEQPGTFIRALGFADARRGFLGNVGTDYYPGVTDSRPFYRTEDGGASWSPVEVEGIGVVRGICGIDVLPQRRIYQGELRAGAIVHAAGRVGGPAAILRSLDGGESCRVLDLAAHAGMILDVKFFDASTGFVCAATSSNVEQANALILRTRDGGATWSRVYRSARPFENCWKMHFPSRRVGYATVQNYEQGRTARVVVKTVDGGSTWRELSLADDARLQLFGIGFLDEHRGWVGGSTTGYETRDGGAHWSPVEMGRAVNKIRIVRQGATVRAFAIGTGVWRRDFA
jgi:photosystem II stability/assembly factor-like uncharacterized protein